MANVEAEVEVHLDGLVELLVGKLLSSRIASAGEYWCSRSISAGPPVVLACWVTDPSPRPSTGQSRDDLHRAVDVARVEVGIFVSAIWRTWSRVRRPTFSRFGSPSPCRAERLLDQHGGGRRLRDEVERAVLVDRDLDRDDPPVLLCGLGVERLAELHDVDAVLPERRADRRRRVRLSAGICSLIMVRTFFAISRSSSPGRIRARRHLTLEDVHEHLELLLVRVDVDDLAVEVRERAGRYLHRLAE
jgi:hypothetical protein